MDRYLYKAKRLDWRKFPEKEQWITGYYVLGFNEYEQPVHLIFEPTSMFFSHGETDGWTEIDPSTLCQCTGLMMEEVQQYRQIGTVEECRTAREKQIPKKPDFTEDKEFALCPCCNCEGLLDKQKYCDNCGQKLDWSDEE